MVETARPTLVQARPIRPQAQTLEAVRQVSLVGGFDPVAWHVMNERDNALVAEEILHGAGSTTFVYNFEIQGKQVAGVSVVGARHLAAHYQGLKHRLVAAMQKTGSLFTFTSYPAENLPMAVSCSVVRELKEEADFYAAVVEMTDLKTGNSIQVERREPRYEYRRDGSPYERPNYPTIAQSKAYRNAVLALVPQDILIRWKEDMLRLKKTETITDSMLDEKRAQVIRYAAQQAIAFDRRAVEALTLDQIAGLGDAAREGRLPAFVEAARALGLEIAQDQPAEAAPAAQERPQRGAPLGERRAAEPARQQTAPAAAARQAEPSQTAEPAQQPAETVLKPQVDPAPARRRVNFEM